MGVGLEGVVYGALDGVSVVDEVLGERVGSEARRVRSESDIEGESLLAFVSGNCQRVSSFSSSCGRILAF